MKLSYKSLADILVPGIVLAALLAVISGIALLPRLGQQMQAESPDYGGYEDVKRTKELCERDKPKLVRLESRAWGVGEEIKLAQVFEGTDADGNATDIEVLDIQDEMGNSKMDSYQKAEQKLVFLQRGIYLLKLQTTDGQRKSTVKSFALLVDSRSGGI